jgi:hypothetical protein
VTQRNSPAYTSVMPWAKKATGLAGAER